MTEMDDFLARLSNSPYGPGDFYAVIIPDEIAKLKRVLEFIEHWERISDAKLKNLVQSESEREHHEIAAQYGYDYVNDEAFMLRQIAQTMYANLAVTVATSAETFIDRFCGTKGLSYKNKSGKEIEKPNLGHKKRALEKVLNVRFENIDGFEMNRKARVMGNCFKHNDGCADEEFSKRYGSQKGEALEYDTEDWGRIIEDTKTFLLNIAEKL